MKMKYIIELEEVPFSKKNGDFLYRVKGFNSLVFDMNGLQKLERYDKSAIVREAYERGKEYGLTQANASEYARGYEAGLAEGRKQAESKDEQEESKDDEIRVGDEVIAAFTDERGPAVVTQVNNEKEARYIYADGATGWDDLSELKKTGRHFSGVTKMMEAMRK